SGISDLNPPPQPTTIGSQLEVDPSEPLVSHYRSRASAAVVEHWLFLGDQVGACIGLQGTLDQAKQRFPWDVGVIVLRRGWLVTELSWWPGVRLGPFLALDRLREDGSHLA